MAKERESMFDWCREWASSNIEGEFVIHKVGMKQYPKEALHTLQLDWSVIEEDCRNHSS
jgi:hypothetical protein